jgi:SAM-dependent methyltransferase
MTYSPQVDVAHYTTGSYRGKDRWLSYWYQLNLVRAAAPRSVVEIGPGEGVVTQALRRDGIMVTTCDIAVDLYPDVVGSITALPLPDKSFDLVLAAEVLEHIRYEDLPAALAEIKRVARVGAVIALPHAGYTFACEWKLPLLPRMEVLFKIPFFWKTHAFNGQHYWELGKRGFSIRRFIRTAHDAGLHVERREKHADDPAHRFFLFSI